MNLTPTRKLALGFVALAIVGVVIDRVGWLQAWMPNVVVGALTVAVTITVIEHVIRREEDERIKPHRDDVLRTIGESFTQLLTGIALNYADDPGQDFIPMPADPLEIIELWLLPRGHREQRDDWIPALIYEGNDFAARLEDHRHRDREVIPLDLIRAIDQYKSELRRLKTVAKLFNENPASDKHRAVASYSQHRAVEAARTWLIVYNRFVPEPLELMDGIREIADKVSRARIDARIPNEDPQQA